MLSPDVPQVRGLPPRRGPAALPAELSLRRLLLLGRPGLPVQRRGQLRRCLCPERGARRVAGAQLLWWVPSLPATPSPKPNRICLPETQQNLPRMPSLCMHVAFPLLCLHSEPGPGASDRHSVRELFICSHIAFPSPSRTRGSGTGSPIGQPGYSLLFQEGKLDPLPGGPREHWCPCQAEIACGCCHLVLAACMARLWNEWAPASLEGLMKAMGPARTNPLLLSSG